MHHFKAFDLINLQYEIRIWQKIINKATNDSLCVVRFNMHQTLCKISVGLMFLVDFFS